MGELRQIERLDEAKIERIVDAVSDLLVAADDSKWAVGDALLAELPMVSFREAGHRGRESDPQVRRYLEVVARRLGRPRATIESYRVTAAMWPPLSRHPDQAWSKHLLVQSRPDRDELIILPYDTIREKIGRVRQSVPASKRPPFANISKAAEAAIEVLSDEDIAAEKRVKLALTILVKFFEEAAAVA